MDIVKTFEGYETSQDLHPLPDGLSGLLERSRGRQVRFAYRVASGERLEESFPISPDAGDRSRLEEPDEKIPASGNARLVMDGHLDWPVYRSLGPDDMTRGELIDAISETFQEIQRIEEASKDDGVHGDDGVFGLGGRHIAGFWIEGISIHRIEGQTWITIMTGT